MKKITKLLSMVVICLSLFMFVGCVSDSDVEKLKSDIISLEEALSCYDEIISSQDETIAELEGTIRTLQSSLRSLRTTSGDEISALNKEIEELTEELNALKGITGGGISVNLADKYYLVVGDTFQLFYRSVITAVDPYGYYIKVTGTAGHTYNRYYEFTPERSGNYILTIEVCDDNGNVLGTDSTVLVASKATKTQTKAKNVLVIGDSLTASGQWIARGVDKFIKVGGQINTVGTVSKTISGSTISGTNRTVKYEGISGWQWQTFLNRGGEQSPFASTQTSDISFRDYMTRNSITTIDEVYIMLTFNGFDRYDYYDFTSPFLQEAKELIDDIHRDIPGAKITIMSIPLTSTYAGLGAYYEINRDYSDNYGIQKRIHEYDNFLEEWCNMDAYKGFMRYVDVKGQFDSEYNMPSETKAVNNTNGATEKVGNSMGMHPNTQGYNQIGDAFFRALMSNWGN